MKKGLKILFITIATLLVLIMTAALIIPVAFKDKIKEKVEAAINNAVNAKITFADYKLSLLKAFPNASFSLSELSITGAGSFESDTLAAVKSFNLVFNLMSLFGDKGYEIKSIAVERPLINAIRMSNGTANWDIMKEKEESVPADTVETLPAEVTQTRPLRVKLQKLSISDGRIGYTDNGSGMAATIGDLDFSLSGSMSGSRTTLIMDLAAEKLNFMMDRIAYLNDARLDFNADIDALLDSMIFTLKDNSFRLNDIVLNFSGQVAMPGEDIDINLAFNAPETSFKSLLSLVPAFYMKDFAGLNASGIFELGGTVKGTYSSADSTIPDIAAKLLVRDGMISYPELPEKITAINISSEVRMDGREFDKTTLDVSRFHFELAGNPFDMTLKLANPESDPAVTAVARGKIDLARLQQALPLDSLTLDGLIDISLDMAGRMSMIEDRKFNEFKADGSLKISDMRLAMNEFPEVKISNAAFAFTPAYAELKELKMDLGKRNDFFLAGKLENYIPYLFSDGIIRGNLMLASNEVDLNEILDILPSDTTEKDTTALAVIHVPADIDFIFNANIGKLTFNKLTASEVRGNIYVKDGMVTIKETGMKALGGSLRMNATYDSRDTLKPELKADMVISSVSVRESFNTFNTVQKLMPIAKGLGGNVSLRMSFGSLLGKNIMPLTGTISGVGEISSESLQVVEAKAFDQMKGLLKIDPAYTNTMKDLKATFIVSDGRVFIKPFDTKLGNIKANISGDHGLDQTLNYLIKTEIPRSELGTSAGALMASMSAQAAAFGMDIAVPDIIRVNLNISGTFAKPVIKPVFAGGAVSGPGVTAVTQAVKEEVNERVNEAARQQADKILKEAEETANILRKEAESSAETIRKEADLQGKKLIEQAQSKGPIAVAAARKAAETLNKEADKKATQLVTEANRRADQILAEAKTRADELLK